MLARTSSESTEKVDEIIDEVEKLPAGERQMVTRQLELYQGDLPHPDILDGYNKLYPNAAEKIIKNGIAESEHRRSMDKQFLTSQVHAHYFGQVLAFIFGLVLVIGSLYLILSNHPVAGGIFGGATLLGAMGIFTNQKSDNKKDKSK
ncbi:DUF2335 domain-containing protein [Lactococcus garvieae]|uniref:DUF2335 domain-containing protein n=1 Tax=Lactococcus garvieae TaxID=1363 RepID=UPI0009424267|nr:DUF2335 domain-containing protein [Lactococcus garvieae]